MKVIEHRKFGSPDELQVKTVDKPIPGKNDVLIEIYTSTVTSSDCNMRNLTFAPSWAKIPFKLFVVGIFKPRIHRLGVEMAGVVAAVGEEVKGFRVGDQIFGTPEPDLGTHGEYISIQEDRPLTKKPRDMSWEDAAAMTLAGTAALFYIRDLGKVDKGQKVLINGASGAIGTFAVQLAKYYGAEVTGVCSTSNIDLVKSLGADYLIDYTQDDFTKDDKTYDVVFDVVNKVAFSACKSVLKPNGLYLAGAGQEPIWMLLTSIFGGKKVLGGSATPNKDDLNFLKELYEAGRIQPVIDRKYRLEEIVEAFKYVEKGHKKGNVIIEVRNI